MSIEDFYSLEETKRNEQMVLSSGEETKHLDKITLKRCDPLTVYNYKTNSVVLLRNYIILVFIILTILNNGNVNMLH